MDIINLVVQYIVFPLAAFAGWLYVRIHELITRLTVLEARSEDYKISHDKEMTEIKETTKQIFAKLDSIEGYLRK